MAKRRKNRIFIILVVAIIIALGLLIWFIFNREPNFTGDRVSFDIVGSRNIQSGGLVEYRILYENLEGTSLKDVEITMIYPDGFTYESSSEKPENGEGNKWKIRKISPGDKEEITISGKLCGNPDDIKNIKALFDYTPSGVASSYQEEAEIGTKVLKTSLAITSSFPKLVSQEDSLSYSIKIKNEEKFNISNLRVKIEHPSNFEFVNASPGPSSDNKVWNFSEIAAGEEKEIKLEHKVIGELEEKKDLTVEAGVFDQNGTYYKQKEEIFNSKISKIDIDLKYSVNKKETVSIDPGKELNFNIHYKNTGTETLPDAGVEVEISKEFLEEKSIKVEGGRYSDGKINWDSSNASALKSIKKGKGGDLKFSAKIKKNIDSESVQDPVFKSKANFTSSNSETRVDIKRDSNEIEIKVNSLVKLESIGRFYDFDNKKIGSGPIPPKVGETTKYRVYLFISNTTNEIFDGKVEISLPKHVSWTGVKEVEVGNLSFINKKLIWDIGKIDRNLVSEDARIEANFEVGITPNKDQVDKLVTLVNKTVFTGKDRHTDKAVKIETKPIKTDLEGDPKIKEEQGKVKGVEEEKSENSDEDSDS